MKHCTCGNVLLYKSPSLSCLKCTLPIPSYDKFVESRESATLEKLQKIKDRFSERYKVAGNCDNVEDFIESIQCAVVRAGGCFMSRSEIMSKTLSELNALFTPNSIATIFIGPKND